MILTHRQHASIAQSVQVAVGHDTLDVQAYAYLHLSHNETNSLLSNRPDPN